MSDEINFQTWICPACGDDHLQSQGCIKEITRLKTESKTLTKLVDEMVAIKEKPVSNSLKLRLLNGALSSYQQHKREENE